MLKDNVVLSFSDVTFAYSGGKPLLEEVSFSVRAGSRITLMGQNGAGKSSIFKLITSELKPTDGRVSRTPPNASVAIARQVMPKEALDFTVREYFASAFTDVQHKLDKMIQEVFDIVHISLPLDRIIRQLSGGQQARLLLAHALIQKPDILLLDEPTNNLDQYGIDHLTGFLVMYEKTCLVISHDADFLNAFTDGVLYLDVHTEKVEQYMGNYTDVVEEITKRIERENLQNARMQRQIREKRAQAEVFAHKGGKLRGVAKRMRESAEKAEENIVSVRREDKPIRKFTIPSQDFGPHFSGIVVQLHAATVIRDHKAKERKLDVTVRKGDHVVIAGPNGIGQSTLLAKIAGGSSAFATVAPEALVGYYQQDFGNLDGDQLAFDALKAVMFEDDEHLLRSTAAGFLLDGKLLTQPIGALSEGQKGLLSLCRFVLQKSGLLILDEPTNHINFHHLPILAKALDDYSGALIMVSHIPEFVSQIRIDTVVDMDR